MAHLFVSYARENKADVDELVRHLDALGYQTWLDSSLRGGQSWWEEILRCIAECNAFVAIVSRDALNSIACKRELQWALALDKPVLPVAVEQLPEALPRDLSTRQIVDYSHPGQEAAFALAGGLAALPSAPQRPEQLPDSPPVPLSYLNDLVDKVSQLESLTHEQQRAILVQLQPALRSADPEERRGGHYVLDMFSRREDLYADVDRSLGQLQLAADEDHRPAAAPEMPAESRTDLLADPQWADALSAYFGKRWPEAVEGFEALESRYPSEPRVETRLQDARRQHDIATLSDRADAAARDSEWATAISTLENLIAIDSAHPDARARLEQARTAAQRQSLVDETAALHQAGRWDAVPAAAQELAMLDPEHADPGGIVSEARARIREPELSERYARGLNLLDRQQWQEAVELFAAIEQQQPGYRDATALLATTRQQQKLGAWAQADAAEAQNNWEIAITALEKICGVDPKYRDAGTRLQRARAAAKGQIREAELLASPDHQRTIDKLLDRAVSAINRGDRAAADTLASRVLEVDRGNAEAEELLAAPVSSGEIRRMTIVFIDLVDSTALSSQIEPEAYRTVVGRYRDEVLRIVDRYEGHVASTKGDGLLAVFGYPHAHEDDIRRAVQASLDITSTVAGLSQQVRSRLGVDIDVRVGVHHGLIYLDTKQDDVYGFAANFAQRICTLAEPGTVVISDAVERLIRGGFELVALVPKPVKGVGGLVSHFRVVAEREMTMVPAGPLVGRVREIAYLEESWARAKGGTLETAGLVFHGEAGIGKSRLACVAVDMAEQAHVIVLQLIGSPLHTGVGMYPVRRLLERRCGITRASDTAERLRYLEREIKERGLDTATVVPLLAPVLGIAPESGYQAVQAEGRKLHDQIAETVHDYLLASMRESPTLLVVEDMHWFDQDTIEVVHSLLGDKLGHVLIVMTGREQGSLPDSSQAQVFNLKPLTDQEADELILALDPDMDAEVRGAVRRRCDGVPLYIEEVVAKLEEQPTDASQSVGVPDTLYEALLARLRSSDQAVLVVEAAAIIGRAVDRGMLLSVVDLNAHDVDRVIDDLVRGRVLEPADKDSWRFRHELLREVAAELAPPSLRRQLHNRVADALVAAAADGNPEWSVVAAHFQFAERYADAATAFEKASADARRRGALEEARTYLTQAISQIEQATPGPERSRLEVALRLRRGFLAIAAEGYSSPDVAADFQRCLQLSGTDLEDEELISTLTALFGYYAMRADLPRVEQLLESMGNSITSEWEWSRPYNEAGFGMLAWYRGEFASAQEKLESVASSQSEETARRIASVWFMPNEVTASVYTHLALARYLRGDLRGAEAELMKTQRRCEKLDFPQGAFSLAYERQMEVLIDIEAGRLVRAKDIAVALTTDAERHGFDGWVLVGAAQQAVVDALSYLATGAAEPTTLQAHITTITTFVDTWRALEALCLITFYDTFLARLLIAAGQIAEARDRVNTALELAQETGMRFYDAELLRIRAGTHENDSERRADLRAAIELAQKQGAVIFELRAAAENFECYGERQPLVDAIGRFPPESTWPELSRAEALLGHRAG